MKRINPKRSRIKWEEEIERERPEQDDRFCLAFKSKKRKKRTLTSGLCIMNKNYFGVF